MKIELRPSLLDRMVSAVNPRAGASRLAAKAQLAVGQSILGGSSGYRGAQPDRTKRRGVNVRARSANADTLPGSARLRAEQRDAAMNQPIATAALNRKTTFTIGTGIMAIPSLDGDKLGLTPDEVQIWEQRLAADFDAYMSSKDVDASRQATGYGTQTIVELAVLTSGDILALRVMPDDQPGRVVSTAWMLVEADRLCNPPGVMDGAVDPASGNIIAGGIEVDKCWNPVAYYVLKQHPGDLVLRGVQSVIPERIEAWDTIHNLPNVVHVFKKTRPELVRGVGMLATVLEPLRMISDASDAELFATVMSAMIAVVYKSPGATPMPEPDYGDEEGIEGAAFGHNGGPPLDVPNQYKFESGSVMEIDSDAEVDIKTPGRPNSAFEPFFQAIVRQIGAAIGVPAGVLMLMFNSSYTASKAELETLYLDVRAERAWFSGAWCSPTYLCFLAEKVARGDYVMPGFFADPTMRAAWAGSDWRGDGKITLNPAQEANGFKIQQDNGWKTGEQITAELTGGSFRENIRKRGAEHKAWIEAGLPVAVPPGTPANQAANAGEEGGTNDKQKDEED